MTVHFFLQVLFAIFLQAISAPSEKSGENAPVTKGAYNILNDINQSEQNTAFGAQSVGLNDVLIEDKKLEFNTEGAARNLSIQPQNCYMVCIVIKKVRFCTRHCG